MAKAPVARWITGTLLHTHPVSSDQKEESVVGYATMALALISATDGGELPIALCPASAQPTWCTIRRRVGGTLLAPAHAAGKGVTPSPPNLPWRLPLGNRGDSGDNSCICPLHVAYHSGHHTIHTGGKSSYRRKDLGQGHELWIKGLKKVSCPTLNNSPK